MYMNKRTGVVQDKRPDNFREERVEERSFEYITLDDGTEVTTYVDDTGKRMYMDWDSQRWMPFPEDWYPKKKEEEFLDEEHDPRVGEYVHPKRGVLPTYLFENSRNTRLYFDETMGQWARMPLAWERNIPEVKSMLEELDGAFPKWKNVNEQLLALRECNYDLQDAIVFAEINWSFDAASKEGLVRKKSSENSKSDDVGTLSLSAARRIEELERALAAKEKEFEEYKLEHAESATVAVKQLTREKTKVENDAQRKERLAAEAQERVTELTKENLSLQNRLNDLEKKLVAHQADADKIKQLQDELETVAKGGASAASANSDALAGQLKKAKDAAEQQRLENVALKLKVQSLKEKLSHPAKSEESAKLIRDLHSRVKIIQKEKNDTKKELEQNIDAMNKLFASAIALAKQVKDNTDARVEVITKKYRAEQMQRKLLYNKVQELKGNIRVFARVRKDPRGQCVLKFPSDTECVVQKLDGKTELLEFEHVYAPDAPQEQIFADTKPLALSCVDGYNVCIMAYGQTGSGKTFTMMGPVDNPGVNRRAIRELLEQCKARDEIKFKISVSIMEIYNENIYDLLTGNRENKLAVHQGPNGVYVGDLTTRIVSTQQEIEEIMAIGDKNRSSAATNMNTDSSRSHLLLQLLVEGENNISGAKTSGKLTLVDLAGSERVSKTDASGDRLVEAAAINKSLTSLGQVFKALATNAPHIPYRNSKLTHVLQDSLGGDSKTCVFVNVSPLESNLSETYSTLLFGQNIRKIELGPATKNKAGPPPGPPAPKKK